MGTTIDLDRNNSRQLKAMDMYNKHLKPFFGIGKVISNKITHDLEDSISFVTLTTITGIIIEYELRFGKPMFVNFVKPPFSMLNERKYIASFDYPEKDCLQMFKSLEKYAEKSKDEPFSL